MKLSTRISDLRLSIQVTEAEREVAHQHIRLVQSASYSSGVPLRSDDIKSHADKLNELYAPYRTFKTAFHKLPPARRVAADKLREYGLGALEVRFSGGRYSGNTEHRVQYDLRREPASAYAYTSTSRGAKYSSRCLYSKTDATHVVGLDPAGVPLLFDNERLTNCSRLDGLPLIALYPEHRAVWVVKKNKQIVASHGWVVYDSETDQCYHSTRSLEHAEKGLARKVSALKKEREEQVARIRASRFSPAGIESRRVNLIARLCKGTVATLNDALSLGFCTPGIQSFQEQHRIGNTASLPDLIRTRDPSAVRLALHVARKVSAERTREKSLALSCYPLVSVSPT